MTSVLVHSLICAGQGPCWEGGGLINTNTYTLISTQFPCNRESSGTGFRGGGGAVWGG